MRPSLQVGTSGLLWMALLSATTAARAEPPTRESVSPPAATSPELTASDPQQQAEALLEQARDLFRKGEYRRALPLVERAYILSESPRFLFNLGVLHHKLSECVPARDHFELYLQQDPLGEGRVQALAALEELRARCPSPEAPRASPAALAVAPPASNEVAAALATTRSEAPPLPHDQEPPERSGVPSSSALLLLGVGVATGIGALVSLAALEHAQSEIDNLGSQAARSGGTWDEHEAQRQDLATNARLYRGLSIGLGVACAAFVGAGTTVWILETRDGSNPRSLSAGVTYRGEF